VDLLVTAQRTLRRTLIVRGVKSDVVPINGHPIHHYHLRGTGTGPPIVLVHGLGGSANGFFKILFAMSRRFSRVLAPDLPGHGFSPLPPSGPLLLQEQLELLRTYVREVVAQPSVVVGNSLGAAMCIKLAYEDPKWVRALALISPAGGKCAPERLKEVERAMTVKTPAQARALTRRLFHRTPIGFLLAASELRKMYGTPPVLAAFKEAQQTPHLEPEVLAGLSMPVLLLWGESEKLLPYECIDYFREHLPPHARIEEVRGFGHVPQVERPREVERRLIDFANQAQL
jgi:pimeloyl-ACP methyl ester carboxylesterase